MRSRLGLPVPHPRPQAGVEVNPQAPSPAVVGGLVQLQDEENEEKKGGKRKNVQTFQEG